MKSIRWLFILTWLFLAFIMLGCAKAGTYSLYLRYQPVKEFPSLPQKIGSTLAMAPFKDERPDTLYIGIHTNLQGDSNYFKSQPFPLEKAIKESLSEALSRYGVKKEGKVFTRNVEVEKEMTVARSTPQRVEAMINQILTDIFDSYFSNPY